jgi:hypothetical protein
VLLRAVRPSRARQVTRALRSRPLRVLAHPVTALTLSTGTLAMLYVTPLYNATMEHAVLHEALHLHILASGCLFAWAIAGPDPAPGRTSVPARLVVLGVAIAAHATISQLMYGGFLIDVHAPIAQDRGGDELMYYGGDIAEILLAAARSPHGAPIAGQSGWHPPHLPLVLKAILAVVLGMIQPPRRTEKKAHRFSAGRMGAVWGGSMLTPRGESAPGADQPRRPVNQPRQQLGVAFFDRSPRWGAPTQRGYAPVGPCHIPAQIRPTSSRFTSGRTACGTRPTSFHCRLQG